MKLIIFSQFFFPFKGGIQRLIKSRIDCLNYQKLKKTLLITSEVFKNNKKYPKQIKINYSKNRFQQFYIAIRSIYKAIYNQNNVQIECASIFPSGIASAFIKLFLRNDIKIIIYLHGDEILKALNNYLYFYLIKFTSKFCDEFIANSHYIKKFFISKIHKNSKVDIINPIPSKNFYKKKIVIKKNRNYTLLSVCRLIEKKNLHNQINAFENIYRNYSHKYNKLNYIICGIGPEYQILRKIIKSRKLEKVIKIYNDVNDKILLRLYKNSDIFIMTTLTNFKKNSIEGFGISALEASLYGMTCILPKKSGSKDLSAAKGVKLFVNGYSVREIEKKILYALESCKNKKNINSASVGAINLINKSYYKYNSKF